jgi:hypothetical protein
MRRCLAPLTFLCLLGCEQEQSPPGPKEVVLDFIVAMRSVHGGPESGVRVVKLLWEPARDNLQERARRASALSGRELNPAEMIAPSWFALRLVPEETQERLDGRWAEVLLLGASGERALARCVMEGEDWKVALELPPLAPIRQRDTAR